MRKDFGTPLVPQGLLGRFSFDGDVRNSVPGERFRCKENNGAELTTDRFGSPEKALLLSPGDIVTCDNVFEGIGVPYTVMVWARPTTVAGNQTLFMTDFNTSGPYYGLRIKILDGTLDTFYGDGTVRGRQGRRGTTSPPLLEAGEWVHLAAVVESRDEMRLYIDGQEVPSTISGTGGPMRHNDGPTSFGSLTSNTAIDDFYLFQGAVPADRIARVASNTL
ncbi:MAG: LamG domain-containing protein [Bacteroidota bacterium]